MPGDRYLSFSGGGGNKRRGRKKKRKLNKKNIKMLYKNQKGNGLISAITGMKMPGTKRMPFLNMIL